jgi:hypothetical protein
VSGVKSQESRGKNQDKIAKPLIKYLFTGEKESDALLNNILNDFRKKRCADGMVPQVA